MAKFFSLAGQLERLKSAGKVLAIATGLKKGRISTPIPGIVGKVLTTAAEHPFITAGLGAVAVAPKAALTVLKAAVPKIGKALFGTPKRAGLTILGAGVLQASPIARTLVRKIVLDPTKAGRAVGSLIEKTVGEEVRREPMGKVAKALAIGGAVGLIGAGAIVAAKKFKEKKAEIFGAMPGPIQAVIPKAILPAGSVVPQPSDPMAAIVAPTAVVAPVKRKRAARRQVSPLVINQIQISN